MVIMPLIAGFADRPSTPSSPRSDVSSLPGQLAGSSPVPSPSSATMPASLVHTVATTIATPAVPDGTCSPDLIDLLSRMTERLREALDARGSTVFLTVAGELRPFAHSGAAVAMTDRLAMIACLSGPELVPIEPPGADGNGAVLAVPINDRATSVGLLLVSNPAGWRPTTMERELISVAARLAGIAVAQDRSSTGLTLNWRQIDMVLNLHGDALMARDGDGAIIHVNGQARGLLCLEADAPTSHLEVAALIQALDMRDQWGQRVRPAMLPYARALTGLPAQDLVVSCKLPASDHRRWLLLHAHAIADPFGQIALVLTILRDFAAMERYDAAQRLRASITHHLRERPLGLAAVEREIGAYIDGSCSISLRKTEPAAILPHLGAEPRGAEDRPRRRLGQRHACEAGVELRLMCGHLHHSDPVSTWRTPPQPAAPTHVALIPIEGDGDRLGTITCRRSARQPCFDAEEIALLRELAGQIGLATAVDRLRESLSAEARRIVNISQRVQDVEEIERRRMALSIHDGLAQVAASVCQQLEIVTHRFAPSSDEESAELARALSLAQRTVAEARMLIAGLRPVTLDQQGLTAAIFEEIHRMRADGWSIRYVDSVSDRRYDGDIELTLYRVVQEALANIRKHAGTVPVEVVLEQRESAVHVEVRDEGPGFDPRRVARTSSEHIGLQGMSERVGHLGGTIVISSTPGHGTQVSATVPLDKEGPRG